MSGSWAPRLPAIKEHLDLDAGDLGIALAGLAVGLVAGTRLAGRSVDRFGTRLPLRVGLVVQCLALVGVALAPDLATLTGAFAFLGLAGGFIDVTMNANAVVVERLYARPIMSGLHGLWSVGLLAGSAVGTAAAAAGAGIGLHFGAVAAALVVVSVVATASLLPTSPERARRLGTPGRALSSAVLLLGLIAFGSFAGEGSAADWGAVYMHERVGTAAAHAGVAFVAFSVGMIGSRFAADAMSARLGPTVVTRAGGLVAAGGIALAVLVPHPVTVVVGYLLFGVGLAPIVPIAFSAAGNAEEARTGPTLGAVVTIGYLGTVVGPLVIGFTADALGLRLALLFPVLLALMIAALAFAVAPAAGRRMRARAPVP